MIMKYGKVNVRARSVGRKPVLNVRRNKYVKRVRMRCARRNVPSPFSKQGVKFFRERTIFTGLVRVKGEFPYLQHTWQNFPPQPFGRTIIRRRLWKAGDPRLDNHQQGRDEPRRQENENDGMETLFQVLFHFLLHFDQAVTAWRPGPSSRGAWPGSSSVAVQPKGTRKR